MLSSTQGCLGPPCTAQVVLASTQALSGCVGGAGTGTLASESVMSAATGAACAAAPCGA